MYLNLCVTVVTSQYCGETMFRKFTFEYLKCFTPFNKSGMYREDILLNKVLLLTPDGELGGEVDPVGLVGGVAGIPGAAQISREYSSAAVTTGRCPPPPARRRGCCC